MKFLLKFFLSLCFLLVCGYHYHAIHSSQDVHRYTLTDNAGSWAYDGFITAQSSLDHVITTAPSGNDSYHDKVDISDDNDDDDHKETLPVKKYTEFPTYLTELFSAQPPGDFFNYSKERFTYSKHYCYSSSRHIHFRVFRV